MSSWLRTAHGARRTALLAAGACILMAGCTRLGPQEPTGLPGEMPAEGPAELTLRFRPPAGSRTVCPAHVETVVSGRGTGGPVRQTLGGDRDDIELVEAVDGAKRTVRRTFGGTRWMESMPLPAPDLHDLPPTESRWTVDESGRIEGGTADQAVSAGIAAWIRLFDAVPGWPAEPLRPGDVLPRPLRGPGPPGSAATLETAAPLTFIGYARIGGRLCAKFRSDVAGQLWFVAPGSPAGTDPIRSVLRGTGWLYFDVETGMQLGALHLLHYGLPLPSPEAGGPAPEFFTTFREGPCTFASGPAGGTGTSSSSGDGG
jgi:hypothetical protein